VKTINATDIVGTDFPTAEGRKLAEHLLNIPHLVWSECTIDLTKCSSGLLISAFFNAFLRTVHEKDPERLDEAKTTVWVLEHDFQQVHVANWVSEFNPGVVS